MDVRLPPELRAAIDEAAAGVKGLAEATRRLSDGYRAARNSAGLVTGEVEALAYALYRLPATFAAVTQALGALAEARPGFMPETIADLGAGPGTAAWAAVTLWPEIISVTLVERNRAFLELSETLAREAEEPLSSARRVNRDLGSDVAPIDGPVSLALFGYALTELAADAARRLVLATLAAGAERIVIVEPGTPRDHARLMEVRAAGVAAGARVVAPCPHAAACPLPPGDWCHFSVRLPRTRQHLRLKGGNVPFEDEPFSYLILEAPGVQAGEPGPARILRRPEESREGIRFRLCRPDGTAGDQMVVRRDAAAFRAVRRLGWGDGF
jgi:ribosomal protein RSM22 (predicted rRNA methylase)